MNVYVRIEDGTIVCATIVKPTNLDGWEVREVASLADVKVGEHIPTQAEISQMRASAYRATVDPITCEIQRLRDMGGSAEEIAEAEARREAAVAAIKAQHPYPEDEVSTVDSSRL